MGRRTAEALARATGKSAAYAEAVRQVEVLRTEKAEVRSAPYGARGPCLMHNRMAPGRVPRCSGLREGTCGHALVVCERSG